VGPRAYALGAIQALGPIAGGFSPLFRNTSHQLNYQTGVNIFSNPVEKGFELVVPDTTIKELARLDDQVFRDGSVMANNTQYRTLVFFPKEKLAPYIRDPKHESADPEDKIADAHCSGVPDRRWLFFRDNPLKCAGRASLSNVMTALNELVLVGDTIKYLNRVRVEANPPGAVSLPPSDLKSEYTKPTTTDVTSGPKDVEVTISGKNLTGSTLSIPDDKDKLSIRGLPKIVSDGQINASIRVKQDTAAGKYPIRVTNPGGSATVDFEVQTPQTTPSNSNHTKNEQQQPKKP
jgi:hypothetical protein